MFLIRQHRGFAVCYMNYQGSTRALDKREYLIDDNFCYFSLKQYVVTPHLNHLGSDEGSQHIFYAER